MFRIGGSAGTGITSGLDRPGYRTGIGPNMADVSGPLVSRPAQNKLTDKITSNVDKKPTGLGLGTIPGFLTSLGLNIASATPTGNIFSTIAGAAKDPFDTFQQAKFAEAKEEREFEREKELQMLKNLDEDDRIQIQKEAQVLADNPESEFFGKYNEALNALAKKKIYGVDFMPGEKREKTIEADAETIRSNMRVNKLVAKRMAAFEYDFDSIQKKNEDLSFDIEDPYWTPGRKTYKEGLTYHDAISGKYFTRDSNAPGGDGVPQGFVEIQINK
jgi:ribosomal protein L21E